jgi:hypothetical protein
VRAGGFVAPEDLALFSVTDSVEEVGRIVDCAWRRREAEEAEEAKAVETAARRLSLVT